MSTISMRATRREAQASVIVSNIAKAIVRRFNAVTFRQWGAVATLAVAALLVYAGRVTATGAFADRVGLAASAVVGTLAIWAADRKPTREGGEK